MKVAVISFPGSSSEDMVLAIQELLEVEVEEVDCQVADLSTYDAIILPGGLAYGNYLRGGALASRTPVMNAVKKAASAGKLVLGVSTGFHILLEAGLLPGAMLKNKDLKFHCAPCQVQVVNNQTAFTVDYQEGELVSIPVAHGDGNYYCDQETLQSLEANKQIVFRYAHNHNGSIGNIAGIVNQAGNVLGMMPFPERATEELLGSKDGLPLFTSILSSWRKKHATV